MILKRRKRKKKYVRVASNRTHITKQNKKSRPAALFYFRSPLILLFFYSALSCIFVLALISWQLQQGVSEKRKSKWVLRSNYYFFRQLKVSSATPAYVYGLILKHATKSLLLCCFTSTVNS